MKRLSFVIPVYNGERFLPQLIGSLLEQNIPEDEYEMVFVDDCSNDSSVSIIESFSKNHSGIRLIRHERNSRLATTCNTGIDGSKGRYVWIVDQDDKIEPNCLNFLLQQAESQCLDLLLFNYKRINSHGEIIDEPMVFCDSDVSNGKAFVDVFFPNDFDSYLLGYRWRALFSKEYLRNQGIRFADGMMYDDTVFLIKSIIFSESVASVRRFCYYYRINNEGSITFSKGKKGERIYEFAFLVGNEVADFAKMVAPISEAYSDLLMKRAAKYYNGFVLDLLRTSHQERKHFYDLVRHNQEIVNRAMPMLNWLGKLSLSIFGPLIIRVLSLVYGIRHGWK